MGPDWGEDQKMMFYPLLRPQKQCEVRMNCFNSFAKIVTHKNKVIRWTSGEQIFLSLLNCHIFGQLSGNDGIPQWYFIIWILFLWNFLTLINFENVIAFSKPSTYRLGILNIIFDIFVCLVKSFIVHVYTEKIHL